MTTTKRTPPYDTEAERATLGAAMLAEHAARVVIADTEPEDFYHPAHGTIRATIGTLWREGVVIPDAVMVGNRLAAEGLLDEVGGPGVLAEIMGTTPSTTNAAGYARRVVEAATLRRLIAAGAEAVEAGYSGSVDPAGAIDAAKAALSNVSLPIAHVDPDRHVLDILAEDDSYNWLLDGLLERMDRAIVTAPEGMGKSTVLAQIATSAACGIVPFTVLPNPEGPVRVLVIDLENSARQIARRIRNLYRIPMVNKQLGQHPEFMRFATHMGLDLTTRSDRRWLFERMEGNRPDLVVIGPTYKMMTGNPNDEGVARTVIDVLDECRDRWGITLVIEAHSPHGDGERRTVRPFGASIWKRWPEFGIGMRPAGNPDDGAAGMTVAEVVHWRGPREERAGWPAYLHRNPGGYDHGWPWVARHDGGPLGEAERPGAAPVRPYSEEPF